MVSKCCWREVNKSPQKVVKVEQQSDTSLNYEDECDKKLEITDLTKKNQKLVTFAPQSPEIPPKPKRAKAVEKRSKSAPNLEDLKKPTEIQTVELGQRASMTSIEDFQNKMLNQKEKDDLDQVLF